MNSLIINIKILNSEEISAIEFLYLYYLHTGESFGVDFNEIDVDKLQEKKLIKISEEKNIILRQKSIDLIEISLIEVDISLKKKKRKVTKSTKTIVKEVVEFIDEFRKKWHGARAGAMGGKHACIQKMVKWRIANPTITIEQILAAADLYITTEGKQSKYLQQADYFIYKQDSSRNEASRLSAFVDEILMGTTNEDWTSQLK